MVIGVVCQVRLDRADVCWQQQRRITPGVLARVAGSSALRSLSGTSVLQSPVKDLPSG